MRQGFIIGFFIVVTLGILFLGFNYLRGVNLFSPANKYYGLYSNVDRLAISDPILINGYTVGRVSQISILQHRGNTVLVEFDIESKVVLGDSATATLSADFLGNKSILLSVGDMRRPIKSGDTLRTAIARGLIEMFTEQAEPVANNLQVTMRNLNAMLEVLTADLAHVESLLNGFSDTPKLVNGFIVNTDERIGLLTKSFTGAADNMSISLQRASPLIDNLNTFSDSLKRLHLSQTIAETQAAIKSINTLLKRASQGNNTVGKLLTEDSLYVNINTLIRRLDTLALHLNQNPKDFLAPLGRTEQQIRKANARKALLMARQRSQVKDTTVAQ